MKIRILHTLTYYCLIMTVLISDPGCKGKKPQDRAAEEKALEEQGKKELRILESLYSNKEDWEKRKVLLRTEILRGMNLYPLPSKTPLNPIITSKRIYDGYSVENVSFESIPGYFVSGNLYRPLDESKNHPAVLCPHGHFEGDTLGAWGRFRPDQQKRCATFARMGAIVFSYGMYAWGGEPIWQFDTTVVIEKPVREVIRRNHEDPLSLTMQTWSSIRAIDFLESLQGVDLTNIAVTGASGGGTQSFLLAAVDDRITVSIPVVMVSCHYKDLCVCEKVMPSGQDPDQILNMAEFAAMIAPKPMLLISDGDDWTKNTPEVELPFIKRTYSFYHAEDNVKNVHFPDGKHDYGFEKRVPVYKFLAKHMGLSLQAITGPDGAIDEAGSILENPEKMLSFSSVNHFPHNALLGKDAIERELKKLFFACSESPEVRDKKSCPMVPPINKSLAIKPPMGWNSWDCFGFDVNEAEVKATADFMAKNLKYLGYEYLVLDMNWYAPPWPAIKDSQAASYHIDSFGRLLPDTTKFPSSSGGRGFKPIADYIHSLGLRFGIHILGGIPKKAVDANCPVKSTSLHAQSIIHSEKGGYWYESFNGIDLAKPGGQEYYNSIFELYAQWGVDFIKADYLAFQTELIGISRASRTCGRDMIISAVPDRIPEQILKENAHMARTGIDLWDQWEWLKRSFFMAAIVVKEAESGYWPDMDMLPVGKLTVKSPRSGAKPHMSKLTPDELYSLFSLWYISRMPLFIGGYLPETDPFTLGLITNKEALEVNRNSCNNHQIYQFETDFIVWTADIPGSQDKYVAFFNISDKKNPADIGVSWEQLGLSEPLYNVRDLWGRKDLGERKDGLKYAVNSHGAGLFKISKQQ